MIALIVTSAWFSILLYPHIFEVVVPTSSFAIQARIPRRTHAKGEKRPV